MIREETPQAQERRHTSTWEEQEDAGLTDQWESLRTGGNIIIEEGAPPREESLSATPREGQEADPAEQLDGPDQAGQTDLDRRFAALSEGQWKALQIVFGLILGAAGSFCLFFLGGTITFNSMGLLMAVGVMLVIPSLLQRNLRRSIHLARIVSILSFALLLLAFTLLNRPG
ncbi:MAG: hypothetical protein VB051_06085 [Candidatus Pelethousia sp.]|nr:hypothetical protein [Candidatus Pelethousia sp.]